MHADISAISTWVFDLDNTLYPPQVRLFDQIEERMRHFMAEALNITHEDADLLRADYWARYGTTLAGLMAEHALPPEGFLKDVHEIDFSVLQDDPGLRAAIETLPGRKIIYTNGTAPYAAQVSKACGLDGLFDAIYGVEHAGFVPKPRAEAFDRVFGKDGLHGPSSIMFEDEARNLEVPFHSGLRTVHVAPRAVAHDYISHHTSDLVEFLEQIVAQGFPTTGVQNTSEI
ncbi:MAG: pyrimidine 5'-nucleotidase [Pseudomonadota bacterium]